MLPLLKQTYHSVSDDGSEFDESLLLGLVGGDILIHANTMVSEAIFLVSLLMFIRNALGPRAIQ